MTKLEFMKELESLLLDIPLEEREAALQYYNDYFDDAGEDHENEIITELGSPKRVAQIIKSDLNSNAADRESRGYFTENGYRDTIYNEDKFELVGAANKNAGQTNGNNTNFEEAKQNTQNQYTYQGWNQDADPYNEQNTNKKSMNVGLIILICIFALPVGLPILISVLGVILSIVVSAFAIVFSIGMTGIALIASGIVLFVDGLVQLSMPLVAVLMIGTGLLVFGIGMLLTLLSIVICKSAIPAMIKGIVYLFRMPFKNRSVMA